MNTKEAFTHWQQTTGCYPDSCRNWPSGICEKRECPTEEIKIWREKIERVLRLEAEARKSQLNLFE